MHQFAADNRGVLPGGATIPVSPAAAANISDTGANLCDDLVTEYMAALPVDPLTNNGTPIDEAACAAAYTTGYTIVRSATNNRVTVNAPAAELGQVISVTR